MHLQWVHNNIWGMMISLWPEVEGDDLQSSCHMHVHLNSEWLCRKFDFNNFCCISVSGDWIRQVRAHWENGQHQLHHLSARFEYSIPFLHHNSFRHKPNNADLCKKHHLPWRACERGGEIDGAKYGENLEENLMQSARNLPPGTRFVLKLKNEPKHEAKTTRECPRVAEETMKD